MSQPPPILAREEILELIGNAEAGILPRAEIDINRMVVTLQRYEGLIRMVEILSGPEASGPHEEIHSLVRQFTRS